MKYAGLPSLIWLVFHRSFEEKLVTILGLTPQQARETAAKAKPKYREIIAGLPEFEKGDRFKLNIVDTALLGAFVLNMPRRPQVEPMTEYYAAASMTPVMKVFCRMGAGSRYTQKSMDKLKRSAALRAPARRRPQPLLVEFRVLRLPGRKRLRGTVQPVRHLHPDARVGAVRPDPGAVPF